MRVLRKIFLFHFEYPARRYAKQPYNMFTAYQRDYNRS